MQYCVILPYSARYDVFGTSASIRSSSLNHRRFNVAIPLLLRTILREELAAAMC